jgi:hypothetical protein
VTSWGPTIYELSPLPFLLLTYPYLFFAYISHNAQTTYYTLT